MPLYNRHGFLTFGEAKPTPDKFLDLPIYTGAPRTASVILVPGENYQFFIASEIPLSFGQIDIVDSDNVVGRANIGYLEAVAIAPGVSHYKAFIGIPFDMSAFPNKYYHLRLFKGAPGSNDYLFSNSVWLRTSGYENTSALFSFRNRRAIGPIPYDLPEMDTFRNTLRLKCTMTQINSDTSVETYEAVTTGQKRIVGSKAHVSYKFDTLSTDAFGHEGFRTMLLHKDLYVNTKPYGLKTGYVEGEPVGTLTNGTFELWDQSYSVINRC